MIYLFMCTDYIEGSFPGALLFFSSLKQALSPGKF